MELRRCDLGLCDGEARRSVVSMSLLEPRVVHPGMRWCGEQQAGCWSWVGLVYPRVTGWREVSSGPWHPAVLWCEQQGVSAGPWLVVGLVHPGV